MDTKYISFKEVLKKYNLNEINYTYINRKSLELLSDNDNNIKLRVGEKFILTLTNFFNVTNLKNTDNFDFSGYASDFFSVCQNKSYKMAIYGGSLEENSKFIKKISSKFKVNIVDGKHGFFDNNYYVDRVKSLKVDIVLLGLGNPKQNIILSKLSKLSITGIHTCGAFISQEASSDKNYYNSSKLPRWLVRSFKEKGHFTRVLWTSLTSFFKIIKFRYFK